MAKGAHRPAQRVVLPNGMWVLLYEDGSLKIAGYDRRLEVTEVLNRSSTSHIFVRVTETKPKPAAVASRPSDLVTVERGVVNTLRGLAK
ncbi:hypothetical protein ABT008_29950 [Micromonospora sp. NPDC002389]|uniref:hypothetical protein n=1 Tax=Micromonospora sp. NPDC002389 TaxID=3154272 RepID=UPI00331FB5AF